MSGAAYTAAKAGRLLLKGELPANSTVGGYLYLSGTAITALPEGLSVGGYLDLSGCKSLALPTFWWTVTGSATQRRCIAITPEYDLQQVGNRYSAGCATNLTAKQALDRWNRADERAKVFTAAILDAEAEAA